MGQLPPNTSPLNTNSAITPYQPRKARVIKERQSNLYQPRKARVISDNRTGIVAPIETLKSETSIKTGDIANETLSLIPTHTWIKATTTKQENLDERLKHQDKFQRHQRGLSNDPHKNDSPSHNLRGTPILRTSIEEDSTEVDDEVESQDTSEVDSEVEFKGSSEVGCEIESKDSSQVEKAQNTIEKTKKTVTELLVKKIVNKTLIKSLTIPLDHKLQQLVKKYPTIDPNGKRIIPDPNDKEKYYRLHALMDRIKNEPDFIKKQIERYKNNPMFQYLGPLKFLSFLAKSDENRNPEQVAKREDLTDAQKIHLITALEEAKTINMTDLQKVAIYGYTSADYRILNPAMRDAGDNPIKDPGLKAYVDNIIGGLNAIPDIASPLVLKRAIFAVPSSELVQSILNKAKHPEKNDPTHKDPAFMSTIKDLHLKAQGPANLEIHFEEGQQTHAKNILAFSAWQGEEEILLMPNREYTITKHPDPVKQNWVILKPK